MKRVSVLFVMIPALLLSAPAGALAEDVRFQTTEEEMVRELTRKPASTRSWQPVVDTRSIVVVEKDRDQTVQKTITVSQAADEPRLNLKIEFDYDSYAIREASFPLLDELGRAVNNPKLEGKPLLVKGHTDADGSASYNLTLSLHRALSVKQYLVANHGVFPERVKAVGYGEAMPLVPNTTAAQKQTNRRVEVQVGR